MNRLNAPAISVVGEDGEIVGLLTMQNVAEMLMIRSIKPEWRFTRARARPSSRVIGCRLDAHALFCRCSATNGAKYVSTPSQPARLKAIRLSIITLSRSSQPFCAAAMIIAYSPDTW